MVQKISILKITLFIIFGIFCLPAFSSADIESTGQLYWPESYIASNSGMPDAHGGTNVNKYTYASTFTANLGFSLDLNSNNLFLSKSDGELPFTLSNTLGEWFTGATFAATPIIKYGNEWSSMGYSEPADPKAEVPRGSPYCCSWNAGACPGLTSSSFVAFKCSRSSVTATSSNPSVASVSLAGSVGTQKIQVGTTTVTFTHCYSTGGSTVYCDPTSQTNPNSFYYPENQQININPLSNGTTSVTINTDYNCQATLTDNYCSYRHDPGVWEYLYYNVAATDVPAKTLNLSKTLNVVVSNNHRPTLTISIDPLAVYNHPEGYIDDITATINATDIDGDLITGYEFEWYEINSETLAVTLITDGSFTNSGSSQTLKKYKARPEGTKIFARGRVKDSNDWWSYFVQSENVLVVGDCAENSASVYVSWPAVTGADGYALYKNDWINYVIEVASSTLRYAFHNTLSMDIFKVKSFKYPAPVYGNVTPLMTANTNPGDNNVTPVMTSNSTPSPHAVSATREYGINYQGYLAFDNNTGTMWQNTGGLADTLRLDYGVGNEKKIVRYSIEPYSGSSYAISSWTFQGSNDNVTWNTLDTQSGVTVWSSGTKTFDVTNSPNVGFYRFYRLNITYHNDDYIVIREVKLYDTATAPSVSATREYGINYQGYLAFDNNTGTMWQNTGGLADTLRLDYGVGNEKKIVRYSIEPYSGSSYAISSWTFQGSNDNVTWNTLDTQSGVTVWSSGTKTFDVTNSPNVGFYRFYRLNITYHNDDYIVIREVKLFEPILPVPIYSDFLAGVTKASIPSCNPSFDGQCGGKAGDYLITDTDYRFDPACLFPSTLNGVVPTFPSAGSSVNWTCDGSVEGGVSKVCTATKADISLDTALNCNLTTASSTVSVNKNTIWTATPNTACPTCTVKWSVTDINNPNPTPIIDTNPWNKIFTTTGLKTVTAQFFSSTNYGNPCTATTNVLQSGTIIEQ